MDRNRIRYLIVFIFISGLFFAYSFIGNTQKVSAKSNQQGFVEITPEPPVFDESEVETASEESQTSMMAAGGISGTVYRASDYSVLSGIYVCASNSSGTFCRASDSNGNYIISGLTAGYYTVLVMFEDGWAHQFYNNTIDQYNDTYVNVTDNNLISAIDFYLSPGGTVTGTVTDTTGNPLEGISVEFYSEDWNAIFSLRTSSDGSFSYSSIPYDSEFTVNTSIRYAAENGNFYNEEYWEEAENELSATPITLTSASPSISNINFTLVQEVPTFGDVNPNNLLYDEIKALYDAGYTSGCSTDPLLFCPDTVMDRGMAAVFMLRGQYGASYTPANPTSIFGDNWSAGPWAQKWSEAMYNEGLSSGCSSNPLMYCPWTQLNRQEASVFGLRMKHGMTYTPPAASGTLFADMTNTGFWGTKWAEQAYLDGLLPACGWQDGKPMFCPEELVDRGWGAYLVVTAKDLLP